MTDEEKVPAKKKRAPAKKKAVEEAVVEVPQEESKRETETPEVLATVEPEPEVSGGNEPEPATDGGNERVNALASQKKGSVTTTLWTS